MTSIATQTKDELVNRINNAMLHHDLYLRLDHYFWKEDQELLKFTNNMRFFSGVHSALFNSIVVLTYSLFETRSDTANFHQLLRQIKNSMPSSDFNAYIDRVNQVKPLWIRVSRARNLLVGHQTIEEDRVSLHDKAVLVHNEIRPLLDNACALLSEISERHLDGKPFFADDSSWAVDRLYSRIAL